jgi:hypothetical protein
VIAVGALSAPDVLHNDVEGDSGVFGRGAVPKEHEPGGHASDILVLLLRVFLEKQRHVVAEGAFGVDGVIGIRERVKIVDLWRRPQRWRLCPPQPPRRYQAGRLRRPQHGRWRRPQHGRWRLCPPQPPRRYQAGRLRRPQHGRWRRPQLPLLVGLSTYEKRQILMFFYFVFFV